MSRLSAYHHMGMVSPFKISRDVAAAKNAGAAKFSDEWLTWRGIAYLHCHFAWPKIDSLEVTAPVSSHMSGTCTMSGPPSSTAGLCLAFSRPGWGNKYPAHMQL